MTVECCSKAIDGRPVAASQRAEIAAEVAQFKTDYGPAPGLATVLVGDDPACVQVGPMTIAGLLDNVRVARARATAHA